MWDPFLDLPLETSMDRIPATEPQAPDVLAPTPLPSPTSEPERLTEARRSPAGLEVIAAREAVKNG